MLLLKRWANFFPDCCLQFSHSTELQVLPHYFRHSNVSSFCRQLTYYGFRKLCDRQRHMEYAHPLFLKDDPEAVKRIRRKTNHSARLQDEKQEVEGSDSPPSRPAAQKRPLAPAGKRGTLWLSQCPCADKLISVPDPSVSTTALAANFRKPVSMHAHPLPGAPQTPHPPGAAESSASKRAAAAVAAPGHLSVTIPTKSARGHDDHHHDKHAAALHILPGDEDLMLQDSELSKLGDCSPSGFSLPGLHTADEFLPETLFPSLWHSSDHGDDHELFGSFAHIHRSPTHSHRRDTSPMSFHSLHLDPHHDDQRGEQFTPSMGRTGEQAFHTEASEGLPGHTTLQPVRSEPLRSVPGALPGGEQHC